MGKKRASPFLGFYQMEIRGWVGRLGSEQPKKLQGRSALLCFCVIAMLFFFCHGTVIPIFRIHGSHILTGSLHLHGRNFIVIFICVCTGRQKSGEYRSNRAVIIQLSFNL
eukprot:GEMP01114182.1.p2 GENE.GEMP01114182.1~~GEMP01114182.1.p2  ORF type:complete len:110 (-),score=7.68 GEMP01114182.1:4-333(-)